MLYWTDCDAAYFGEGCAGPFRAPIDLRCFDRSFHGHAAVFEYRPAARAWRSRGRRLVRAHSAAWIGRGKRLGRLSFRRTTRPRYRRSFGADFRRTGPRAKMVDGNVRRGRPIAGAILRKAGSAES